MTYDCFSFFNELDILEIRLNILNDYVDYFVIGESKQTFSNKAKPLNYLENQSKFEKWNHKIIYIEHPTLTTHKDSFDIAAFQKDNLKKGLLDAKDEDIIYFGDVDEIWKPKEIDDETYNLRQLNYCYYLNNRSSEQWVGTIISKYKNIKNNSFNYLRANHINELQDGGWHFTNIGGLDQILKKLDAYDHQEFNNLSTIKNLKSRIENNQDYIGRQTDWRGVPFSFKIDESDLPKYLIANKDKYKHLFK
jgi:beta-1,4-mannosyl-glycoprotein beta-1,4-N-acetylglucosaminyltransferase